MILKRVLLIVCIPFLSLLSAQEEKNEYSKFSLDLSREYFNSEFSAPNSNYGFGEATSTSFGVKYKLFEKNNWSLSTGIKLRYLKYHESNEYSFDPTGTTGLFMSNIHKKSYNFYIPLEIDKKFIFKNDHYLRLGIGAEFGIYSLDGKYTSTTSVNPVDADNYYSIEGVGKQGDFSIGLNTSVGYGIPTKAGLFEVYGKAQMGLSPLTENEYKYTPFNASGETGTITNSIKNSYVGFGISYFPKLKSKK